MSRARPKLPEVLARLDEPPPIDDERRVLRDRAHGLREVRTGAARSRILGTVSHGRLYQTEVAPPGLVFSGDVLGSLDCIERDEASKLFDYPHEALVLWLALHLMVEDGVGGNKSAGSGALAWAASESIAMKLDGAPFTPQDDDASTVLGLLGDLDRPGVRT